MSEPGASSARRAVLAGSLALAVAALWLGMTVLKETPSFWRNAGGYPVGLRQFVLDLYYPITAGLLIAGLFQLSAIVFGGQRSRAVVVVTLVFFAVLAAGLGLLVANNVVNLMEGRELHAHPDGR